MRWLCRGSQGAWGQGQCGHIQTPLGKLSWTRLQPCTHGTGAASMQTDWEPRWVQPGATVATVPRERVLWPCGGVGVGRAGTTGDACLGFYSLSWLLGFVCFERSQVIVRGCPLTWAHWNVGWGSSILWGTPHAGLDPPLPGQDSPTLLLFIKGFFFQSQKPDL